MPDRIDHATAESTFRTMLTEYGMPAPDEVTHWRDAILFGWSDTKTIIVVDLDEYDPTAPPGAPLVLPARPPGALTARPRRLRPRRRG